MYSEIWSRKPLHSTALPKKADGSAMGLAEADGGAGRGVREARRALTSSSKASAGSGRRGSIPIFRSGLLSQLLWRHKAA